MALPRVTGVVWWEMGLSHYKAVFRRARRGDEEEAGYTKDYLQAPKGIGQAFRLMFGGVAPPHEPITYRWPGGSFPGGKIYPAADYDRNGRIEVGQWTGATAPHPWRVGDPSADPLITFPGSPDAVIPDEANAHWEESLADLEPWLMMVQLDRSKTDFHLRAYLGAPPSELVAAGLDHVPSVLRDQMRGRGGLAGDELPELWFDPADFRNPWRTSAESDPSPDVPPVTTPKAVGIDYQPANESVTSTASEPFEIDPNERDRATQTHAVTQNAVAAVVQAGGATPLSPVGEPSYDLAWEESDGSLVVVEVKSVTAKNVERQLRLGLGQVLRYRHVLAQTGRSVRGLLVLSDEHHDERWQALCGELGVGLIWLPDLEPALADWLANADV